MNGLDILYIRILELGFLTVRHALCSNDTKWSLAEIQFLHNIPSLIAETNPQRHKHFWQIERILYLEQLPAVGNGEAEARMKKYYQPIFDEMQPIMDEIVAGASGGGMRDH